MTTPEHSTITIPTEGFLKRFKEAANLYLDIDKVEAFSRIALARSIQVAADSASVEETIIYLEERTRDLIKVTPDDIVTPRFSKVQKTPQDKIREANEYNERNQQVVEHLIQCWSDFVQVFKPFFQQVVARNTFEKGACFTLKEVINDDILIILVSDDEDDM